MKAAADRRNLVAGIKRRSKVGAQSDAALYCDVQAAAIVVGRWVRRRQQR